MSDSKFHLLEEERGLIQSALNEVLNGFETPDFERRIGMNRKNLDDLLKHLQQLRGDEEVTLDLDQARALRNVLLETIRELGVEEFQTRTGHELSRGYAAVKKLGDMLRRP